MFKIFPTGKDKIPLIRGWQQEATNDQEKIKLWRASFNGTLGYWSVPTGPDNDLLVLDIDCKNGKNGFNTLQELGLQLPLTMTQRTASGGMHFFFRYPKDGKQYGNKAGILRKESGLDVRGAGGYVCFYGTDQTPIADPPAWMLQDSLKPLQEGTLATLKVVPEIAIGIIERSLEAIREAPEGESNNVLNIEAFRVGQLVASGSVPRQYAEEALFRAAKLRGKPDYEAKRTIESGLDGGSKKPLMSPFGVTPPVPLITIPDIPSPTRYTPRKFTREDLMNISKLHKPRIFQDWSSEDITITVAEGGTGKTTLKLFEAVCLALGERFLGFNCLQPGKTLFFTGEDTAEKLAAIIGQMTKEMKLTEAQIDIVLDSVIVKKDADLCLIQKDKATGFLQMNTEALRKVMEAIDDHRPKLVVFDPISSFWGSESALNDMNKAVIKFVSEIVDRFECQVEMINHSGKQSSKDKDMSQYSGRGGSGLPSNSRISRSMRSIFDEEYLEMTGETLDENTKAICCRVNKYTDSSPLFEKPFLILRNGYLFSRKTLTAAKIKEQEDQLTDIGRVFNFIKEQRDLGKYPNQAVLVAHFMAQPLSVSEARTKRALNMLVYSGHEGEKVKLIENPDMTIKDKVYTIES